MLQVLKFEFQKFRFLEILNLHPCITGMLQVNRVNIGRNWAHKYVHHDKG